MKKRAEHNPILKKTLLEVVQNQLRDNKPTETRQTYDRLRAEGFTDKNARVLIASAIAAETYHILKSGKPFNQKRFVRYLEQLPDQNFDED